MLRHLPNLITVLRLLLVVPMCLLISAGHYDQALFVVAVAGASDALDGYLAKRFDWQSWIGGMLDPLADKCLLIAAFVSLALAGELPLRLTALVVGRDLVIVAGALAYHHWIGRFDAAPSTLSKWTTLAQIVLVLVELLRLSQWLPVPGLLRGLLLAITAGLTLGSGIAYVFVWGSRSRRALGIEKEREGAGRE